MRADEINELPDKVRQYVHDLETRCDPAGDVAALTLIQDQNESLQAEVERLRATVAERDEFIADAHYYEFIADAHYGCIRRRKELEAEVERLRAVKDAAIIFGGQGHRRWCPLHDDASLARCLCTCGLRELRDTTDALREGRDDG